MEEEEIVSEPAQGKTGLIYFSYIPPGMDVRRIRETFSQFGEVGRIYLEKDSATKKLGKKTKFHRYSEGWLEFKKKKIAKRVAEMLNGQQVGGKRKNVYFDCIWSIKYLHRFKWHHLKETIIQERVLNEQRLRFELDQARKETNFYLEQSEKRKKRKSDNSNGINESQMMERQKETDETIRNQKQTPDVDLDLLKRIFN
ncbi:uncharacterized protein LOC128391392 [Panonychus citri]|uniref:uncharacterized protein LOC128391392 n=1 Tax=Panonychus citri TaxID=50023 RepID=UPI002307B475|nr:uncharacterized protein LOC128391392 [Panonychus citri]